MQDKIRFPQRQGLFGIYTHRYRGIRWVTPMIMAFIGIGVSFIPLLGFKMPVEMLQFSGIVLIIFGFALTLGEYGVWYEKQKARPLHLQKIKPIIELELELLDEMLRSKSKQELRYMVMEYNNEKHSWQPTPLYFNIKYGIHRVELTDEPWLSYLEKDHNIRFFKMDAEDKEKAFPEIADRECFEAIEIILVAPMYRIRHAKHPENIVGVLVIYGEQYDNSILRQPKRQQLTERLAEKIAYLVDYEYWYKDVSNDN